MKKNMFIVDLVEINQSICARLCEDDKHNFAEDVFGNHVYINDFGEVVAWMHEYEPEDYIIASSLDDFYSKYTLYDIEEIFEIIERQKKKNKDDGKEEPEPEHHVIIELYKAKAVVGKDFIDLSFFCDDDQYDATEAYNKGKITEEELNKMSSFSKSYLKDANRINREKHNKNNK